MELKMEKEIVEDESSRLSVAVGSDPVCLVWFGLVGVFFLLFVGATWNLRCDKEYPRVCFFGEKIYKFYFA